MTRLTAFALAMTMCISTAAATGKYGSGRPAESPLAGTPMERLVAAIQAGDNAVVRDLLDAGAEPDAPLYTHPWGNGNGSTPVMVAAAWGNIEAMRLLVEAGGDIHLSVGFYGSALHAAARYSQVEAARWLLDAGVDGDVVTNMDMTPLHVALWYGHDSVAMLLLESGVCIDCEFQSESGGTYTALGIAASSGNTAIVVRLLAAGADVNKRIGDGHFIGTPLAHAAHAGRADVVEILVAAGAEINSSGDTPLHGAALMGHLEIVRRLVALGADLTAPNPDRRTALTLARNQGHDDVAAFLVAAGAER